MKISLDDMFEQDAARARKLSLDDMYKQDAEREAREAENRRAITAGVDTRSPVNPSLGARLNEPVGTDALDRAASATKAEEALKGGDSGNPLTRILHRGAAA